MLEPYIGARPLKNTPCSNCLLEQIDPLNAHVNAHPHFLRVHSEASTGRFIRESRIVMYPFALNQLMARVASRDL